VGAVCVCVCVCAFDVDTTNSVGSVCPSLSGFSAGHNDL
jgi:hypothetical protein